MATLEVQLGSFWWLISQERDEIGLRALIFADADLFELFVQATLRKAREQLELGRLG